MELKINPHHKNTFPIGGILIKHTSVLYWLKEIQRMNLNLETIQLLPIPDTRANSIWGCMVIFSSEIDIHALDKNELCQKVSANFYIPEKTLLYPSLTQRDLDTKFASTIHLIHPDFGLVGLTDPFDISTCIELPETESISITIPEQGIFVPSSIHAFQVKSLSPEEVLKNLEENFFPKHETLKEKPLSIIEKVKLGFYKLLFSKSATNNKTDNTVSINTNSIKPSRPLNGMVSKFQSWLQKLSNNRLSKKLEQDFEDLEKRNQKQIDKLLDLFKHNLDEALKYAIPLDDGSTRGGNQSKLDLTKRWMNLSWLQQSNKPGSGTIDLGNHYQELQKQYYASAQELLDKKEYQKAAFVYLKLLKSYNSAAQALESGKYYQEAATIYIKHAGNKTKAAECYVNGKMTDEAIKIFKELNENEKVGDLYTVINKQSEANLYYEKVVDDYKLRNQYIKASLIYKNKIKNPLGAQSLLLEGWRNNRDASNCLNNYFSNISDVKTLKNEIHTIYKNEVTEQNSEFFLTVIQHEYKKGNELAEPMREIAYEIVAKNIHSNPFLVSHLRAFNKNDTQLIKDTMRFKQQSKLK